jgi:hypothetical protein
MKVAIHQPSYAPWCGYFAKIRHADAFIFLDDAQMCKNNLINRNKINAAGQEKWLTIPVSFNLGDPISATRFADPDWARKHVDLLRNCYRDCPHFGPVMDCLAPVYEGEFASLADLNIRLAELIMGYLGIERPLYRSSELDCPGKSDDRLVDLVLRVGGGAYISGPGGMRYQDPAKFEAAGLGLEVVSYHQIPYPQPQEPFVPNMAIMDALFNVGPQALDLLRYD